MSKTVLITGTSSGLGRATARHFHAQGWNVVATMRRPEAETELVGLDRMLVTRLDVEDDASIAAAVDAGLARFGQIDVLVNNAGYGAYGPLEVTQASSIRRQFAVNVFGPLATIQAVLPHFRARRSGAIVNVSSIGGRLAFPLGTLYHGTKFALEGASEALQYELGAVGVRVKLVEPGGIRTDFGGRSFEFSNDPLIEDYQPLVQSTLAGFAPLMENGSSPEQIAEVVYAAATDETPRLRHRAGADAEQILDVRATTDDVPFFEGMRARFGLAA